MVTLPKNALQRIALGQSFAEYDIVREDPALFVTTPASIAAEDPSRNKCFFVGRRGAGKTAIAYYMKRKHHRVIEIFPKVYDLIELPLKYDEFRDTRQRPFKSLVSAFERALMQELVRQWLKDHLFHFEDGVDVFTRERNLIEQCDFDTAMLSITDEIFGAYKSSNPRLWLRQIKRSGDLSEAIRQHRCDRAHDYMVLIDRIDDSWDGSDSAIIALMALMHACVQLTSSNPCIRPYLFLRENIFERIRKLDNEFVRLETSVVFLDWSTSKLEEMIERRCVRPFNTKPALGGEAWACFFDESASFSSKKAFFSISQTRPRDALMLASFAIESAINAGRPKIGVQDIENASERYSTSRLKDLGDEFDENFPNVDLVLKSFFGLSTQYTLVAIEQMVAKLLVDSRIAEYCSPWFFERSTPQMFIETLYSIGFLGIANVGKTLFRTAGADEGFVPKIEQTSTMVVHPTYWKALGLRDLLLTELPRDSTLRMTGILEDLPDGIGFEEYKMKLKAMLDSLRTIPLGNAGAAAFEELIGELVRLCFFRALTNVQQKCRSCDGRTIKDWIASNRASQGFWEMLRTRYGATQVIWECKNYADLSADDFQQAAYYMNDTIGRFAFIAFRGDDVTSAYLGHISRIQNTDRKGLIMVLRQKDLETFVRQAINGKVKESHIADLFDKLVRAVC